MFKDLIAIKITCLVQVGNMISNRFRIQYYICLRVCISIYNIQNSGMLQKHFMSLSSIAHG